MTQAKQIMELRDIELIVEVCKNKGHASSSHCGPETISFCFDDGSRIEQDSIACEFRAYDPATDSGASSQAIRTFEY